MLPGANEIKFPFSYLSAVSDALAREVWGRPRGDIEWQHLNYLFLTSGQYIDNR